LTIKELARNADNVSLGNLLPADAGQAVTIFATPSPDSIKHNFVLIPTKHL
jgi:hypothetical protein